MQGQKNVTTFAFTKTTRIHKTARKSMVYLFRVVSDEVDDFKREIKIDADATFLDLRNAISDAVGYSKDTMSSFFLCDRSWEKDKEITLEDMTMDSSVDPLLMSECVLSDYIEDEGQRLIYTFDYLTDRSFFLELKEAVPGVHQAAAECVASVGDAPGETVDLDAFDAANDAKAAKAVTASAFDLDDDLYGDSEYNDDEFDVGGFSDMEYDER